MRLLLNFACLLMLQGAVRTSNPNQDLTPPDVSGKELRDRKLPNGKSQNEAILKADYEKSLRDAAQLVELSQALQKELKSNDSHVLSLTSLKNAEEIEKIAKRIHSRLKH